MTGTPLVRREGHIIAVTGGGEAGDTPLPPPEGARLLLLIEGDAHRAVSGALRRSTPSLNAASDNGPTDTTEAVGDGTAPILILMPDDGTSQRVRRPEGARPLGPRLPPLFLEAPPVRKGLLTGASADISRLLWATTS